MRNPKNFDYDKQKPFITKPCLIKRETESNNDEYKKPPLIKGVEITQGEKSPKTNKSSINKSSLSKNKLKINNSKVSYKKTVDKREKSVNMRKILEIDEEKLKKISNEEFQELISEVYENLGNPFDTLNKIRFETELRDDLGE